MAALLVGDHSVELNHLDGDPDPDTELGAELLNHLVHDVGCQAKDGPKVVAAFTALPQVARVLASGDTKGSVVVSAGSDREVQVDLRVVEAESFGAAWQYFTGSKEHNVRLRELAIKKGWRLNEYGLNEGDKRLAGAEEADIYKKLGLVWIPPELREDRGELDDLTLGDRLLRLDQIQGDAEVLAGLTPDDVNNPLRLSEQATDALKISQ